MATLPVQVRYSLYRVLALLGLAAASPFFLIMYILVRKDSPGPFVFTQLRAGRDKKPFTLYKIRTMVNGAESRQRNLYKKNEADGPVFKIRNDPRYTRLGKFLSHTGLDESLQLINVAKGEMSLVGPRPLPLLEAQQVPARFNRRFSVLPGMTSEWITKGAHKLSFKQWMRLDVEYAKNPSLSADIKILFQTALLIFKLLIHR